MIMLNMTKRNGGSNQIACKRNNTREGLGLVIIKCRAWDFEKEFEMFNTYDLLLIENLNVMAHAQNGSSQIDGRIILEEKYYQPKRSGCLCKNYYEIRNLNSTASYDRIELTWEQSPWLLIDGVTVNYTDEKGSVDMKKDDHNPNCYGDKCTTSFDKLTHCTLYKVCLNFMFSEESKKCIWQRTRCAEGMFFSRISNYEISKNL